MELHYQSDENGNYLLVDNFGNIISVIGEIGLLYDGLCLLKHGPLDLIKERLHYMSEVYRIADIPHDLHIISGKISADELNKIVTTTGYKPVP